MAPKTGQLSAAKKSFYFLGMVFFLLFSILTFKVVWDSRWMAQVSPGFYIYAGLFGVILMGCLFSSFMYGYKVFQPLSKQGWIKDKLVFTESASFIFWILLTNGFINTRQYAKRGLNYQAKTDLHNIYLACKAYWADSGSDKNCNVDITKLTTYGYVQSMDVSVSGSGTEPTFTAKGRHAKETKTLTINSLGAITEVDGN